MHAASGRRSRCRFGPPFHVDDAAQVRIDPVERAEPVLLALSLGFGERAHEGGPRLFLAPQQARGGVLYLAQVPG